MFHFSKNAYSRKHQGQRGFTLVEILIVMMIIGVLTTIVGGNYVAAKAKSRDAKRKNDASQLQRALEAHISDFGTYPTDVNGTIHAFGTTTLAWGDPFIDPNTNVIYMTLLPNDVQAPAKQYRYEANSTGTEYQIFLYLENENDVQINSDVEARGLSCGNVTCNFGLSSSNTTLTEVLN